MKKWIKKILVFQLLVFLSCWTVSAQEITVSGKIILQNGEPLPGASVVVKGTSTGTIADEDGNFSLNIPEGTETLVISFIGMKTKEVPITSARNYNVIFEEDVYALEEVVAIGYGTARKSEVTGSVGRVSNKELEKHASFNVLNSLRGKIAGVEIFTNSGSPFGNNRVIIRGVGTINADAQPLYVVNGVQTTNISYLNSNDIENIEVLKDASSAAIYGARGANGVILITTKKGTAKEGLTVEYSTRVMGDQLAKKHNSQFNAMNAEEFMAVQRIGYENAPVFKDYPVGREPKLDISGATHLFDSQGNPLYDTNWEKESTRFAVSHDHQLNVQLNSPKSKSGFFANYIDRQEVLLNSYAKRANMRFFHEARPTKWLTVSAELSLSNIWSQSSLETGWSITRLIHEMPPIFPVKWPDGTYSDAGQTDGTNFAFETQANPVSALKNYQRPMERTMLFGNLSLNFNITSDLNFISLFGVDNAWQENKTYAPTWLRYGGGYPLGRAAISNSKGIFWQSENYLNYNKNIGIGKLNAMMGVSWQQNISSGNSFTVTNFPDDHYKYYYVNAATTFYHPTSSYEDWTMHSVFARATYVHKDKYSITFTGRADGSSRFGANNKYGFFPSGGISWLVSEENFMSEIEFINRLRLRTSYGVVGNTEIGSYESLATIGAETTLIGGKLQPVSYPTRLANENLEWEKTSQYDIGFEIDILDNKVSLEADYYYKLTTDLLLNRPIPETTGFTSIKDNIGSISNRGVELLLTTRPISKNLFSWENTFTFAHNKNRIEKLGEQDEDIFPGPVLGTDLSILRVGESVNAFWGSVRLGTWSTDEAEEAAAANSFVGEKKWVNNGEKTIIGNGLPLFRGSFINTFTLGKFDMTIDLQYNYGNDIYQVSALVSEDRTGLMNGMKTQLYEAWTPDNQNTMVARIRHHNVSGSKRTADSHFISDGSYLRGNTLLLGYSFDSDLAKKIGVNYLRIYASAQNAFIIYSSEFRGYDPEVKSTYGASTNFDQSILYQVNPRSKTYIMGLNITF